ncbi:putative T7SS-secreted protein [Amycolatopsis sp. WQ 127309]|uniref:putative T7SS-secreted protein n=1 Tax=Amycolatopsis sp. WQ 127309 TaxID=2932773 RepID=UPI001FF569BD|nr:polymorphic toxin type 28 domain-containing protein [Amycolatopsis sp. WQ 127309]UOZ08578.1 polymorphic toxin type 28 domain-containing protein [Amycolatopsis sp. WQ 127309]
MAELGESADPKALVPGNPEAIEENIRVLRGRGDETEQAAEGLRAIDTGSWEGPAAHAFHDKFSYEPNKWYDAADALHRGASLLEDYATTLRWAQGQAVQAVALWDKGQAATEQAKTAHDAAAADAAAHGQEPPPFTDAGEPARQAARDLLDGARAQLTEAGDSIAGLLDSEADAAPQQSGWLDDVGNFAADFGGHLLNGLASFGNAMLNHPVDTATMVAGAALTSISSAGEVGGLVLDATGVGAIVGVPANVVSAAGIAVGGTMMASAAGDLARDAAGEDHVEVVKPRANPQQPTKTDRLKEHLTERDLDAARRELDGEVVARKGDGTPWDHVKEVREAQNGLVNQVNKLKRMLADSRLSPADRPALEGELSEASKLLDHSEQWVPRG